MLVSKNSLILSLTLALLASASPCLADMTVAEVVNAVNSSHVLGQEIAIRAAVDGDKVYVSTFRNPDNDERDTKIDAILISKAVWQASKDTLSRITVRFYGLDDTSQYQDVAITAGDIKAYASGQTTQDQLLSSVELVKGKVPGKIDQITNDLVATAYGDSDFKVSRRGPDNLLISIERSPWVSDEKCKLDALAYATKYANSRPEGVDKITVAFYDKNGKADTRALTFGVATLPDAWRSVQLALGRFPMLKQAAAVDVQALHVKEGPLKDERTALLGKLQDLDRKGVGLGPFVKAFLAMEALVGQTDEATLRSSVEHLSASVDDQAKAYSAAKEAAARKSPTASGGNNNTNISTGGNPVGLGMGRYNVLGNEAIDANEVLSDPNGYIQRHERTLGASSAKMAALLQAVAKILRNNGHPELAAPYEQRAAAMTGR